MQVKQLCLGIPAELEDPSGSDLDWFLEGKHHTIARLIRDVLVEARPWPYIANLEDCRLASRYLRDDWSCTVKFPVPSVGYPTLAEGHH